MKETYKKSLTEDKDKSKAIENAEKFSALQQLIIQSLSVDSPNTTQAVALVSKYMPSDADALHFLLSGVMSVKTGRFGWDLSTDPDIEFLENEKKKYLAKKEEAVKAGKVVSTADAPRKCVVPNCFILVARTDEVHCPSHHLTFGAPATNARLNMKKKELELEKQLLDMIKGNDFVRVVNQLMMSDNTKVSGLAVRVSFARFRGMLPYAQAAKEICDQLSIYCCNDRFNLRVASAIFTCLLFPPQTLTDDKSLDSDVVITFNMEVYQCRLWKGLFGAMQGSLFVIRKAVLEEINTLLHNNFRVAQSIAWAKSWPQFLCGLLTDIPDQRNSLEKEVYGYTIMIFTLIHYEYFKQSKALHKLICNTLGQVIAFSGLNDRSCAIARTLLSTLCSKVAGNKCILSSGIFEPLVWTNLFALLQVCTEFVFSSVRWSSNPIHSMDSAELSSTPSSLPKLQHRHESFDFISAKKEGTTVAAANILNNTFNVKASVTQSALDKQSSLLSIAEGDGNCSGLLSKFQQALSGEEEDEDDASDGELYEEKLNPDFIEYMDEASGKPYYFNSKTNTTQWEKPLLQVKVKSDSKADKGYLENQGDWNAVLDKSSGNIYYCNHVTNATQWNKPEGWIGDPQIPKPKADRKKAALLATSDSSLSLPLSSMSLSASSSSTQVSAASNSSATSSLSTFPGYAGTEFTKQSLSIEDYPSAIYPHKLAQDVLPSAPLEEGKHVKELLAQQLENLEHHPKALEKRHSSQNAAAANSVFPLHDGSNWSMFGPHWSVQGDAGDKDLVEKIIKVFTILGLSEFDAQNFPNISQQEKKVRKFASKEFSFWSDTKELLESLTISSIDENLTHRYISKYFYDFLRCDSHSTRSQMVKQMHKMMKAGEEEESRSLFGRAGSTIHGPSVRPTSESVSSTASSPIATPSFSTSAVHSPPHLPTSTIISPSVSFNRPSMSPSDDGEQGPESYALMSTTTALSTTVHESNTSAGTEVASVKLKRSLFDRQKSRN
jgi:hypothetical protein